MPNLKPSQCSTANAFDLLARPVQRWVRSQGWRSLRDIQNQAIPVVLDGGDAIIAAATASGKTEAAFLPLISRSICDEDLPGFKILYLSPLKALINDQYRRLERLCEDAHVPLHKWHGDVAQSAKTRAVRNPGGILLITPESLEATLMRRGSEISRLFGSLEGVVIDELHAFIGIERGIQLLSLLSRIETAVERPIDRFGLSATLGDMSLAAAALRPRAEANVKILEAREPAGQASVDLQILTFVTTLPEADPPSGETKDTVTPEQLKGKSKREAKSEAKAAVARAIAEDLFATFRGTSNLIFANSRSTVETYSNLLLETSSARGVRNEFHPHHGKLSKELREWAEDEIKDRCRTNTLVATSTLEMGVDIGVVESVAQIVPPTSVAALRQRVGRSGRRDGQKPVLRFYVPESEPIAEGPLPSQLHLPLTQAIAVSNLLLQGWCEPPNKAGLHFSTLVHQIMALIVQHAGRSAISIYQDLCLNGPFQNVTQQMFQDVLRQMADEDRQLIEQAADGTLLLGRKGERRVEHFTFYAVFPTPEEYRVVTNKVTLGTLIPDPQFLVIGAPLLFAGRNWDVIEVDAKSKTIRVTPSKRGSPPGTNFEPEIHKKIPQEMRRLYGCTEQPSILDQQGRDLLSAGRFAFKAANLASDSIQLSGRNYDLYPWSGTKQLRALCLALGREGISAGINGLFIVETKDCTYDSLIAALKKLAAAPPPDIDSLRGQLDPKLLKGDQKYNFAVPEHLLEETYFRDQADLASVPELARSLLAQA